MNSFLKFYSSLCDAQKADNVPIVKLNYQGFVVQQPNETTALILESDFDFAGAITAHLVDNTNFELDITNNFYYETFINNDGKQFVKIEFGNLGVDYAFKLLHLRLTDSITQEVLFTNGLFVTNLNKEKTTLLDFWSEKAHFGLSYDVANFKQRVRLYNVFKTTPNNVVNNKQYITSFGNKVNYRNKVIYNDKYLIDGVDELISNSIFFAFSHPFISLNNQMVSIDGLKFDDRINVSSFIKGEFLASKLNQTYTYEYQLFESLQIIEQVPTNNSFTSDGEILVSGGIPYLRFNRNIQLIGTPQVSLYKDNVLLQNLPMGVFENLLDLSEINQWISFEYTTGALVPNGVYSIVIPPNAIRSGGEIWQGITLNGWIITKVSSQYSKPSYNNNYL